ncbi:MAG: SET domain-containing protein [Candidatus Brocadiaceae bacterium]
MKVETRPSGIHGTGVFATEAIRRGEVVLHIDDSRIVDGDHPVREDLGESPDHCDWLPDGTTVLMQPPECYINHSCGPNVFVYSVGRTRFVLASRRICTGEEIVYDYAVNAINGDTCGR